MTKTASAPSVSAALRRAGFSPSSPSDYNRQGIKVRGNGGVSIVIDIDSAAHRNDLGAQVVEALTELGYTVAVSDEDRVFYCTVTREV